MNSMATSSDSCAMSTLSLRNQRIIAVVLAVDGIVFATSRCVNTMLASG